MLYQEYNSEIENQLLQFLSALDGAKIKRVSKDNSEIKIITPGYVLSGITPVLHDLINKGKSVTLPKCVVSVKSISYDEKRVFNKILGQFMPNGVNSYSYHQPTPVKIKVELTVIASYASDLWQMFANYAACMQNYFFTAYTVPGNLKDKEEIRSKVEWAGDFSITYPEKYKESDIWYQYGKSNFTIDTWLFLNPTDTNKNLITSVNSKMAPSAYITLNGDSEYYLKEGWPIITRTDDFVENNECLLNKKTIVNIEGKSFFKGQQCGILIRPINPFDDSSLTKVTITTIKHNSINGYLWEDFKIISENKIQLDLTKLLEILPGNTFDVIIYNNAGYDSIKSRLNYIYKIK